MNSITAPTPQKIEFQVPLGYQVDQSRLDLHAALLDYAKVHQCSYEKAIAALVRR